VKKIHVIFDKKGKIISAADVAEQRPEGQGAAVNNFGPGTMKGHLVAELEVPAEHEKLALHELVEKLQVDRKAKQLVVMSLKAKKS
jgi:hypothetical protein